MTFSKEGYGRLFVVVYPFFFNQKYLLANNRSKQPEEKKHMDINVHVYFFVHNRLYPFVTGAQTGLNPNNRKKIPT